jgi:ABC-type transporter Mla MlaB component
MADFAITAHGSALYFLNGELDMATVPLMEIAIEDAVARGGPITLDLTDVTFADSSGHRCDHEIGEVLAHWMHGPSRCPRRGREGDRPDGHRPRIADPPRDPLPAWRGGDGRGSGCGTIVPLGRSERQSG